MATNAFLEVTFTKSVKLQSGTLTQLGNQFSVTAGAAPLNISALETKIVNGKVRLRLVDNIDCPKPQQSISITYTNPGAGIPGALVDSTTGYPVADLTVISDQTWPTVITPESIRPEIISATVYHEKPKEIAVAFTVGRDMSDNSTKTTDTSTAGFGITPTVTDIGNTGATSNATWNVVTAPDPSFSFINSVILTTTSGEIQNGMTVSLGVAGDHLADQFDLSVNNITTFPVTNNVKKLIVENAFISNTDPSAVICYFAREGVHEGRIDMTPPHPSLINNWNISTLHLWTVVTLANNPKY